MGNLTFALVGWETLNRKCIDVTPNLNTVSYQAPGGPLRDCLQPAFLQIVTLIPNDVEKNRPKRIFTRLP